MKKLLIFTMLFFSNLQMFAYTTWENNPNNWNNSTTNWDNSSTNWKNSPANWANNPMNPNANIIYDNNGKAQGYAVFKENGKGVNIYDFNGNRQEYYNF